MISCSHRLVSRWRPLALGIVLSVAATPVLAQTVYDYQGNNYEVIFGSAFDGTMSVSGSFTLPLELPPNLILQDINVAGLTFSLSNGIRDFTEANSSVCTFEAATGPAGEIVQWNIFLREPGIPAGDPQATLESTRIIAALDGGYIAISNGNVCDSLPSTDSGVVENNPGIWTVTTVPVELQTFVVE